MYSNGRYASALHFKPLPGSLIVALTLSAAVHKAQAPPPAVAAPPVVQRNANFDKFASMQAVGACTRSPGAYESAALYVTPEVHGFVESYPYSYHI